MQPAWFTPSWLQGHALLVESRFFSQTPAQYRAVPFLPPIESSKSAQPRSRRSGSSPSHQPPSPPHLVGGERPQPLPQLSLAQLATLILPSKYSPGWSATMNGQIRNPASCLASVYVGCAPSFPQNACQLA